MILHLVLVIQAAHSEIDMAHRVNDKSSSHFRGEVRYVQQVLSLSFELASVRLRNEDLLLGSRP